MPPQPLARGLSQDSTSEASNNQSIRIAKVIFLVLLATICLRMTILRFIRKKKSTTIPQARLEKDPLLTAQESTLPYPEPPTWSPDSAAAFRPIYPWLGPPQPLPLPFDPNFFPSPTIRRHSDADTPPGASMETNSISYSRRISTNSIPTRQSSLVHGTVTTSQKGWRRNQWVISGE
jgi:hypothetical protein